MSWSGFRPSDDASKYGYNIPGNMYAVAALERAQQLNADVWQDADFERAASHLVSAMRCVLTLLWISGEIHSTLVLCWDTMAVCNAV